MGRLEDEIKGLKETLRNREERLDKADPTWKRKDLPDVIRTNLVAIQALGREFGIMYFPWLEASSAFCRPRPKQPAPSERYATLDNINDAIICDLYNFIPRHFHEVMENHSEFGTLVSFASLAY